MKTNTELVETLFNKATDYGKTSYRLVKLKTLDKTSDVVSTFIPHSLVFILLSSVVLFVNLGLALWIGEILGKSYFGFLIIAALYGIIALFMHFVMHKWLKSKICNYIIRKTLY